MVCITVLSALRVEGLTPRYNIYLCAGFHVSALHVQDKTVHFAPDVEKFPSRHGDNLTLIPRAKNRISKLRFVQKGGLGSNARLPNPNDWDQVRRSREYVAN